MGADPPGQGAEGYPKSVEDRNGNKITFTVSDTPPGEDPGGPKKRITKVTDPSNTRSFDIDYYSKDEAKRAHVRGNIQRITDHSGSALDFDYYDDGNLLRLTQVGGTNANGEHLPDRSFVFTYTTSSGDAAAIPAAADRVNPNPRTPNQSTRIFSVRDPRGHETTYDYYGPSEGAHDRWKLQKRTNRTGDVTSFAYNITNRITTVSAPESRVSKFSYDTDGKVTKINDPLGRDTSLAWSTDFKVTKVTEPSGKFLEYTYDPNGYLTSHTNQLGEKTALTYLREEVATGDTGKHLSWLETVTTPRGTATATDGDFMWKFTYDAARNADKVTDPTGAVTDYDYNLAGSSDPGTIAQVKDPNAVANGTAATVFNAYHASGQPTQITDPEGGTTRYDYDVDGQLRSVQDPNHASDTGSDERAYKAFFDYDSFHRLGRQSMPKSTDADRGTLIWSGADFDANDNIVTTIDPHYGSLTDPEGAPTGTTTYDKMDRPEVVTNSDKSADPEGERTVLTYDAAGRVSQVTSPEGVRTSTVGDRAIIPEYDKLDRVIKQTVTGDSATDTRITHSCYDPLTDDRSSVTLPRADLATVTCSDTTRPFTWRYAYDDAHRVKKQTDPKQHIQEVTYDANGNVKTVKSDIDATTGRIAETTNTYSDRDELEETDEKFTTGRTLITKYVYDGNGNRTKLISPRAYSAGGTAGDNYVTDFKYDRINRLIRTALPRDDTDGTERHYIHRRYDANGNLTSSSLPVTNDSSAGDGATTRMSYFDPGWIRTSGDPVNPAVQFDYTAQGWQAERVPLTSTGAPNDDLIIRWSYFNDGQLKSRNDQGGQPATYDYDANNNLESSLDAAGLTDPGQKAVAIEAEFNGFDEVRKVWHRQGTGEWTFSAYEHDDHGNIKQRRENGKIKAVTDPRTAIETDQTISPRVYKLNYDSTDWLEEQLDLGTGTGCGGNQRIEMKYFDTGWAKERLFERIKDNTDCTYKTRQRTEWTHFDNGKAKTLSTHAYNANQSPTEVENHSISYLDDTGRYVNGHRTQDTFWRTPKTGGSTCTSSTSPCVAKYEYDARERLTKHQRRAGKTDTYTLDQPGHLIGDTTVRAGNVTTEVKAGTTSTTTTTRKYEANQLKQATATDSTPGSVPSTTKFWYDQLGNLDCVTTNEGTQANCLRNDDGTASTNLVNDYNYDYLNRMSLFHAYKDGARTDRGVYTYDPLDRTITRVEDHPGTSKDRTTNFSYQGLSNLVTEDKQAGGTDPKTKTYSYDNYGHRLTLTDKFNDGSKTNHYAYSRDVHGSVSQLVGIDGPDATPGEVQASYGYDAYGGTDDALTTGDDDNQTPLNPYRFSDKRLDSATSTAENPDGQYDMGARRWTPDTSRFAQQDIYYGALANLGLAADPLTQNTYALAGGNPISYIEYDGHRTGPTDPCIGVCAGVAPLGGSSNASDGGHPSRGSGGFSSPEALGEQLLGPPPVRPQIQGPLKPSGPGRGGGGPAAGLAAILAVLSQILVSDSVQPEPQPKPRPKPRGVDVKRQESRCFGAANQGAFSAIVYHNLDHFDRATGAQACLQGRIPERDKGKRFTPPGFQSDDMERGHLIANQFGGSNTKAENIVPLFKSANLHMKNEPEKYIADLLNAGERVYVYVAPHYPDSDNFGVLVPDTVEIYVRGSRSKPQPFTIPNQ